MHRITTRLAALAAIAALAVGGGLAAGKSGRPGRSHGVAFSAALIGYEEVPAVSTTASGSFKASLNRGGDKLSWKLRYRNLESPVQQAHVHFGQPAVNGGVSAFLCSNLPGAPAGVQPCPASPARISGTIRAQDVVGPAVQGIEPGAFAELAAAMRAGVTYANVHTDVFPNGEIRGQIGLR